MRKEIIGIVLFFLVVFTLISLLSYNHADPCVNNVKTTEEIHNLFGLVGAHTSGLLVELFGLGSFWLPVLLLLSSIHFFGAHPKKTILYTATGGLLLLISTGGMLSIKTSPENYFVIFESQFSSGGIIGLWLKQFVIKYSNLTGGIIIILLLWIIGLILATGFSLKAFARICWNGYAALTDKTKTLFIKWNERRKKAKNRLKTEKKAEYIKDSSVKIKKIRQNPLKAVPAPKQEVFPFMGDEKKIRLPSVNLLDDPEPVADSVDTENLKMQSKLLEKKLNDFGVMGKVVAISPGPVITTFEYEPAPGVKINKIVNLTDDLALALSAISIRIVAPIPGKAVIGIEIPNKSRSIVKFKEIVASTAFEKIKSGICVGLGKNIIGDPVVADLTKMPHLLIAGATGTGKSVGLNAMICSILYKFTSEEVKLIMIDPKRIELSIYDGIPHLITPVVTDVKKATNALFWAVHEMERRYKLLSEKQARNIKQYNQKIGKEIKAENKNDDEALKKLQYIVIIIDELADLMMVASRDVEVALTRLAQMARASGIHMILATQRPSVDVLTGIIKANFPTRLTFQVSSKIDSRTIIDTNGAENLLGNGDMLFMPPGTARLQRIHGAYISETEISKITEFLKSQKKPEYDIKVTKSQKTEDESPEDIEYDEKYDDAVSLVTRTKQASISMVQRHLRIGYNRAARIIEVMEKEGVIGPSEGVKPRKVLVDSYDNLP